MRYFIEKLQKSPSAGGSGLRPLCLRPSSRFPMASTPTKLFGSVGIV